jgi:hypothetical protein
METGEKLRECKRIVLFGTLCTENATIGKSVKKSIFLRFFSSFCLVADTLQPCNGESGSVYAQVADIPLDHPSCSQQHAVIQYRLMPYEKADGSMGRRIR